MSFAAMASRSASRRLYAIAARNCCITNGQRVGSVCLRSSISLFSAAGSRAPICRNSSIISSIAWALVWLLGCVAGSFFSMLLGGGVFAVLGLSKEGLTQPQGPIFGGV